jgi:hypothetical protein
MQDASAGARSARSEGKVNGDVDVWEKRTLSVLSGFRAQGSKQGRVCCGVGQCAGMSPESAKRTKQSWKLMRQTAEMSFFEPPPSAPRPPDVPAPHPWWQAPRNELGAPVPLRLVLARSERVAVALVGATAYTTGVALTIAVRWRRQVADHSEDLYDDPFEHPFGLTMMRRRPTGELSPEILRFGVQFSDGRKATTVGGLPWVDGGDADEEPTGPVLMEGGGGGGDGEWDSDFWLWPLPPPGPLTFAVEWPSAQIELTKHEVDATLILEASALSEQLWPEEALTEGSGWSSRSSVLESRAHPSSGSKREDDGEDRSG